MKIRFQFNVSVFKKTDGKATESFSAGNGSFVTCVKKEIANARDRGSFSTAANYDTAIRSLLTFLERDDIKVKDITSDMLENYQKWLLRRNVSLNTISCYMRSLRSIYNRVTKNKGDVFVKTFTGSTPTFKRSLCINDIQRLSILKLPKRSRLALTRDLFLFSFYCQGMPFIDLAFLKKAQIVNGQIIYHRRKTGQIIHITIEPCMENIIKRYDYCDPVYVFPILKSTDSLTAYLQYQKQLSYYNISLKRLGKKAGFTRPLTSYVARHTWASIAFQSNVELQTISRAMGHTNPMTTMIYIKELDNNYLASANRKIITACNATTEEELNDVPSYIALREKCSDVL